MFPSPGLGPKQMLEILNSYHISVGYMVYKEGCKFKEYMDYTLESGLPVIIGVTLEAEGNKEVRHVIQVIGHVKDTEERTYVIYDDSGCYIRSQDGEGGFVTAVTWNELKKVIKERKSFIIYPIHERVYILYDSFQQILKSMMNEVAEYKNLWIQRLFNFDCVRILLADNRDVKKFLKKVVNGEEPYVQSLKDEMEKLMERDMPHYLWYCEVPIEDVFFIFLADPTYSRVTTRNIFLNSFPIVTKEQLSLLSN